MLPIVALAGRAIVSAAARGLSARGGLALDIEVRDRASPALLVLFRKQLPFANTVALNKTAEDFQAAQRARLGNIFTLRREQWAKRSVKIKPFATKTKPEVRISIDPPGGRGDILGKFETDTTKRPTRGQHVAVPIDAKRTKSDIISARDRPRRAIEEGRAFVRNVGGRSVIFERLKTRTANKLGKALRLLYVLKRHVPIKPNLEFRKTARETVAKRWGPNFRAAFARAIRTAR